MSQPSDNTGKSKHHNFIPSFSRLKQHLRKHKTNASAKGKGKGRAEEQPAPGPEGEMYLLWVMLLLQLTNKDLCPRMTANAKSAQLLLLTHKFQERAASGEPMPAINCDCAVCSMNNPDGEENSQNYFSVPMDADSVHPPPRPPAFRARTYNTPYFSGRALPGPLVHNVDSQLLDSQRPPAGHDETHQYHRGQIAIPSLYDPTSIYIPSVGESNTNSTRAPVMASPSDLDLELVDLPPIPLHLLRSLAQREHGSEHGGEN
ncbi:hypothetical protein EV426DRAFT_705521 [Tirmania nivea]|nr:hypothetical protein EV426DRAFT_705521 [Tirmania nivea]